MAQEERLMWTLEDWAMLLDHHLTEYTSKKCMFYMGESVLKLEEKELANREKKCTVNEINESALKDWVPFRDDTMETHLGKQNEHGMSSVYHKKKGGEYKTIVTMPEAKFEIVVERKIKLNKDGKEEPDEKSISEKFHLYYHWKLAMLMDCVITLFIKGKSRNTMKERLNNTMELLKTLDYLGVASIHKACTTTHQAFRRLMKNMCINMKNPFIAKKYERSNLNRCVFFWREDNGGEDAIKHDKKQMIAAVKAVAMGMKAYPLHAAIECNDLDAIVLLLANGIDPNAKNRVGQRPLYLALQNGFVDITKALLLFGADPKKELAKGKSFVQSIYTDHKPQFEEIINIVDDNFEYKEKQEFDAFEQLRLEKALVDLEKSLNEGADIHNLLSLDGGGIRGLVLIEIMDALEKKYGPALLDRFKWVAGTSTGAIMALALGQGKDIAECRRLYFRLKDLVFYRTTRFNPYPAKPLEEFLQREFVETKEMKSLDNGASTNPQKRKKYVAVTTADCSETTAKLRLFRNYPVPDLSPEENEKEMSFKIWAAARSSSAAPTYFPPCARKYVDGGLIANNPVLPLLGDFVACQEAAALGLGPTPTAKPAKLGVVLSLGTGWRPVANAKELVPPEVGLSSCQSFGIDVLDLPTYMRTAWRTYTQMLKGLKNQILRSESSLQNARDWAFSLNGAFFRFNLNLDESFKLDETNNVKLIDLLWKTRVHMRKMKTQVDLFVAILTKTTKDSDGRRSITTESTQSSHESVKREVVPLEECLRWDPDSGILRPVDLKTGEFLPLTSEELQELKEKEQVQFVHHSNMPVPDRPKSYTEYAREEIERDPNVRPRVQFVEHSNMPDAIAMPDLKPQVYVKYIEYAREELARDPNVRLRVQFVEHSNMPDAIAMPDLKPQVYVKYIEYAREELARDPNVRARDQFVQQSSKPAAKEMPILRSRIQYVEQSNVGNAKEMLNMKAKYIEYAREELERDPKVRSRVKFVEHSNMPDAIAMPALKPQVYVKYIEYAREELERDPKVRSRVKFVEHSNMPLAKEMPNLKPQVHVKYIEYAREELARDPNVRSRLKFVEHSNMPDAIAMPDLKPQVYVKYIEYAREELARDPNVRARVQFVQHSKIPAAKEMTNLRSRNQYVEYSNVPLAKKITNLNVKYVEYAREELERDPKVRSRIKFVEHSNMPLAKEMPNLKPQVYVKYIEYAREELARDPNVRSRVSFVEHGNMPTAIEMPDLPARVYVKYIEYAREELARDPNVRSRARFLDNIRENLPLAIERDDLPPPPPSSLDDIPDIDDVLDIDFYQPTMYISPDVYLPDQRGPPKPSRQI